MNRVLAMDASLAMPTVAAATRPLRVGSWPGVGFQDNPVIATLCASLKSAGAVVSDVADPCDILSQQLDILQIHWPEQIFWAGASRLDTARKARAVVKALRRLKKGGTRIVWMVHNLAPHDAPRWQRLIWWPYSAAIARLADGFMTLSPSTVAVVRQAMPALSGKPARFIWHPAYEDAAGDKAKRTEARLQLGVGPSTRLLACLGHLRPYKGVEALIDAFRQTSGDIGLIVAGTPRDSAFAAHLVARAGDDSRIRLILRRLSGAQFKALTCAADEIIAPFTDYLHSGTIVHALSAGKPVCTPNSPFARDFAANVGSGWIRLYQPPLTPLMLWIGVPRPGVPPVLPDACEAADCMMRFYRMLA